MEISFLVKLFAVTLTILAMLMEPLFVITIVIIVAPFLSCSYLLWFFIGSDLPEAISIWSKYFFIFCLVISSEFVDFFDLFFSG